MLCWAKAWRIDTPVLSAAASGSPAFLSSILSAIFFRHILCNHLAEPLQVVAGDSGIHVVFSMIVHVPVKEFEEGIETDRAGTKSEIRDVVLEPPVLGNQGKITQPISDEIEAADHDGQPPCLKDKRHQDNAAMKA